MQEDPMYLWRLVADLSIVDAAILIAGGDPSTGDYSSGSTFDGDLVLKKRTMGHPGFLPAISALQCAIENGEIPAKLHYGAKNGGGYSRKFEADYWVISSSSLEVAASDDWTSDTKDLIASEKVYVEREPNLEVSTVAATDLRNWLLGRGFTSGFFFPCVEPDAETFMDPSHDHFSPELALAVAVWRALAQDNRTNRGTKTVIENWIKANRDAWKGQDALSTNAKDRIVTLVNWRKSGGAPTTSG